jgi:TolB-like protein/class 3 adenylate cyclase
MGGARLVQEVSAQRHLAAILVADVVGYSRLMGLDERETLRQIKAARREVVDPNIRACHGRVVKTTGDGILIEFPSTVEAVHCAVSVQRAMFERNVDIPADRRIEFRVGVHQGDIVVDDDDIFGDGVNVAARLETLSDAGGICVSGRVHEDLAGRLDLPFEDRGEQQVKNIARPVSVYGLGHAAIAGLPALPPGEGGPAPTGFLQRFGTAVFARPQAKRLGLMAMLAAVVALAGILVWQGFDSRSSTQPRGPTVAVLPFDNLSGDPNQDFFSDGVSEALITDLSRFDDLNVLARNTTFAYKKKATDIQELGRRLKTQYIIEGSTRRAGDQISVTAQLIDAGAGAHLWAQTYERTIASTNLLAIQDDVARQVAAAVGDVASGAVARAEFERARGKPAAELSPYECEVHAIHTVIAAERTPEDFQRARACLDATVKLDPTYAAAWADLAFVLENQRFLGLGLPASEAEDIDKRAYLVPRVAEAGQRAVDLAPNKAWAHMALFGAYFVTCQPDRMRVEADRVLGLLDPPDNPYYLGPLGVDLAFAGQWDYGRQLAEKALALVGPSAPAWWWYAVSKDYYRKGDYAKAQEYFLHSYSATNWEDLLHVVYTLPYLGRTDEARTRIPELLKLKPNISVQEMDRFYKMLCFDADYRARMATALRMAGLRETSDEKPAPPADAAAQASQP